MAVNQSSNAQSSLVAKQLQVMSVITKNYHSRCHFWVDFCSFCFDFRLLPSTSKMIENGSRAFAGVIVVIEYGFVYTRVIVIIEYGFVSK